MANIFKRKTKHGSVYYIQYKENCKWKLKSCGLNAKKVDAEYLKNEYSSRELNAHHKAPVRILDRDLKSALIVFRDKILLRGVKGDKEASSITKEKASVNNFIEYFELKGIKHFHQATTAVLEDYFDKRRNENMSLSTRREEKRLLKKFFNFAIKENHCVANPVNDMTTSFRRKEIHPRFFTEKELKLIFDTATNPYRDIYKFLYLTGLRSGEIGNLEWKDFNEPAKKLTIRILSGNKTKREGTILLNTEAIQILAERKIDQDKSPFIFLNEAGNKLDDENIYRNFLRLREKLEIPDGTPHTFRHTTASHLVSKGISIYTVSKILRHRSVKETEIYAHLAADETENAMKQLICPL